MQPTADLTCPMERLAEAAARAECATADGLVAVDELLRGYPADPRLHFLKGSLLAALDRFGEARAAFEAALRIDPQFALARFQLGLLELSSGDAASASATWEPLLHLDPAEPLRLFAEGLQKLAVDDFAGAETRLKMGIERNTATPLLNRDMQLVLDRMAARPASEPEAFSSSAQLLLQMSGKGTRH